MGFKRAIFDIYLHFSQKSEGSKGSLNYQAHEMCMEVHIPKFSSQRQVCHSVREPWEYNCFFIRENANIFVRNKDPFRESGS